MHLDDISYDQIVAALEVLSEIGPALGRPLVDTIAGDKRGSWKQWYRKLIPQADDLLDEHLRRLAIGGE